MDCPEGLKQFPIIEIAYAERNCDLCTSSNLRVIYQYEFVSRGVSSGFKWKVANCVCQQCGFAFVSPSPTAASLQSYYHASLNQLDTVPEYYDTDKRLQFLEKLEGDPSEKAFLEVGSNSNSPFLDRLKERYKAVFTVEPNSYCSSNYQDLIEVPHDSIDIIASYFVLEHVTDPVGFLKKCHKILRDNGFLCIEIPDRRLYPIDPAGFEFYEHVNHFSPVTLGRLAEQCGFKLLQISHEFRSRSFGFVASFQKNRALETILALPPSDEIEVQDAVSTLLAGAQQVEARAREISRVIDRVNSMLSSDQSVVVWPANNLSWQLIQALKLPAKTLTCVDSDPRKSNFFGENTVRLPAEAKEAIAKCSLLVIATDVHRASILGWINENIGRSFLAEEIEDISRLNA